MSLAILACKSISSDIIQVTMATTLLQDIIKNRARFQRQIGTSLSKRALIALVAISASSASINAEAQDLPPGVPRCVSPDGTVDIPLMFTTGAYEAEALRLLRQEAGLVAAELKLPEKLPITDADVAEKFISPFGFSYAEKRIGRITTSKYTYGVVAGNKFSHLTVANYERTCYRLQAEGTLPISHIDTKSAYQLATQWLAAVSMDVDGLTQTCKSRVALSPFWNGLNKLGEKPRASGFVPIYFVWWTMEKNKLGGGQHSLCGTLPSETNAPPAGRQGPDVH